MGMFINLILVIAVRNFATALTHQIVYFSCEDSCVYKLNFNKAAKIKMSILVPIFLTKLRF